MRPAYMTDETAMAPSDAINSANTQTVRGKVRRRKRRRNGITQIINEDQSSRIKRLQALR
jgi:hypothetical protein